jgi:hypothetical protein
MKNPPDALGRVYSNGVVVDDLFRFPPNDPGYRWMGRVVEWTQLFDGMSQMKVEARVQFYQEKDPLASAEYVEVCPTCLREEVADAGIPASKRK